jgi:hypothetical protein
MNDAALRASLQHSTSHSVTDPDGHRWPIRMRRTTDPVNDPWDSWRWSAMLFRRLSSRLRNDTSWYVEVMPSTLQNWESSRMLGTDSSRTQAIERMITAAREIMAGELQPGRPGQH